MEELETRTLGSDDWRLWRTVRLRSLADSPEAFGATYAQEAAYGEHDWRGWVGREEPQVVVLAAGEPLASGAGFPEGPDDLHVIAMWTDPAWRGRRLAARVLDALVEWAAPRGRGLVLDVAIGNRTARRSYEAYGFDGTGETRPIRDGSPELVERMELRRG